MKTMLLVFSLAAFLPITTATAARELGTPSKDSFAEGPPGIAPASFFMGAGFEAGEGYVDGPIEPQLGWTASGTDAPWASVTTANPFTGSRDLRLIFNPALAQGVQHLALSPQVVQPPNTPSSTYVHLNLSNDGGSDYDVIGQAPSQGFISWRVKFRYTDGAGTGPGTIFILDNIASNLVFVDTGVLWPQGSYMRLQVDLDPGLARIRYFVNSILTYTGNIIAGTSMEQLVLRTDNFQLPSETGDFDGWSVQTLGEPTVGVQAATWGQVKALLR